MKKLAIFLISVVLLTTLIACGDNTESEPKAQSRTFELYIEFWNPDGQTPQISFDGLNSSPEIKIDFSKSFGGEISPPNFTRVIIDNVRIIDPNGVNYQIEDIVAYEWREDLNDWKVDVEFTMQYGPVVDLDIMLVLDASGSLGEDFPKIQQYAKNFVEKVLESSPAAKIGVVDFSDVINALGLTNDKTLLLNYIDNISQGPFTSLYEAINAGIDTLQNANSEGKALMAFTDGTDNNSKPQYTPDFLYNKLINDYNTIKINSFMIGFEGAGGVDKPVLVKLAANGGAAEFPQTIDELGDVFEDVSKSISNVYNFTYIRNRQIIQASTPAKLKFEIIAKPK